VNVIPREFGSQRYKNAICGGRFEHFLHLNVLATNIYYDELSTGIMVDCVCEHVTHAYVG